MVHGLYDFLPDFRFQFELFPARMKARSVLIFCCCVLSLHAIAQDDLPLPHALDRSRVFIEGGAFKPFAFSWNKPDPDFSIQTRYNSHFRIGYDRFGRRSPIFLRLAISRREAEVYWGLTNYSKNQPAPSNVPAEFALVAEQGITEFGGGIGIRIGLGRFVYLRPIATIGFISKGTLLLTGVVRYPDDPNNPPPNNAGIATYSTNVNTRDLAFAATLDLNTGIYLNDKNELGFSFSVSQYGLSRKNEKGYSGTLESTSVFFLDNQEYTLRTTMLMWSYSVGIHYAFRFNMK